MAAKPSRIVDSHQHVFWDGKDDSGLITDMDAHGIQYSWLLSWEAIPSEHSPKYTSILNPTRVRVDGSMEGIPLDDLLIAKRNYPERFVLGFCPHPLMGDAAARLASAAKIYGVRVCGEWKFRLPFDDPRCIRTFRVAGDLGMPVVLHLDIPFLADGNGEQVYCDAWYGGTVDNLERALKACPKTNFIGHAPGFWREISSDSDQDREVYPSTPISAPGRLQRLFDTHPNLFADLSAYSGRIALMRDPTYAVKFLSDYSGRLLFARDCYGTDLHEFLSGLAMNQDVIESIYHANAEKLVPVQEPRKKILPDYRG